MCVHVGIVYMGNPTVAGIADVADIMMYVHMAVLYTMKATTADIADTNLMRTALRLLRF